MGRRGPGGGVGAPATVVWTGRHPGGGVASRRRGSVEVAGQRRRGGVEAASGRRRGGVGAASDPGFGLGGNGIGAVSPI